MPRTTHPRYRPRTRGTTTQRDYGSPHQKLRAQWEPLVDAGRVNCHATICLEELNGRTRHIHPGTPWDLGHTPDRAAWTGPEHQRCSRADGARRGNRMRPRRMVMTTSRNW
jgi:hypothetical protein